MIFLTKPYEWLQKNGDMYRGDNASDCMIVAFVAGAKMIKDLQETGKEEKCEICRS